MNGTDIKHSYREQLEHEIGSWSQDQCSPRPLSISSRLAVSLLQKSVRRGDQEMAARATATLLTAAPHRFWRRCVVIAAEEIGVAAPETVAFVTTAATAGKSWRAKFGNTAVAQFLTSMMAGSDKCRAADDLAVVAAYHPSLATDRRDLAAARTRELVEIAISSAPLPRCALALWYAAGSNRHPVGDLQHRRGEPETTFDFLCEAGLPNTMVEIAREGYRVTGEIICAFVPLLWFARSEAPILTVDDDFPPTIGCGPSSWARDIFTPEGRKALFAFLRTDCASARWVCNRIPASERLAFIGGVLFRVESGLVKRRVQWPLATELRRMADFECHGDHCLDATEIMDLLRADLPLLNEVRADVR